LKKNSVIFTAVLYGVAAGALAHAQAPSAPAAVAPVAAPTAAPTKIAVINLQESMAKTKEGQKALAELGNKFGPKKTEYDKRNTEIEQLTDKLNKGRATLSETAQQALATEIQGKTTSLKRFGEDSQAEMDTDEAKMTQELQAKMSPIVQNFAVQNNLAVVLDIGSQNTPVLWNASAVNITDIIAALYDQQHPVQNMPATTPTTAPAPPKPPVKKQ
jgi:outer membrane protein